MQLGCMHLGFSIDCYHASFPHVLCMQQYVNLTFAIYAIWFGQCAICSFCSFCCYYKYGRSQGIFLALRKRPQKPPGIDRLIKITKTWFFSSMNAIQMNLYTGKCEFINTFAAIDSVMLVIKMLRFFLFIEWKDLLIMFLLLVFEGDYEECKKKIDVSFFLTKGGFWKSTGQLKRRVLAVIRGFA